MLYVPRHLPNKLEYRVLSCISVHYQSRMASNGIAITPSHPLTVQAGQCEVGWVILLLGDPRSISLGIQDVYALCEVFLAPPYPELIRILRCLPCRMCTLHVGGAGAIVCCMQWWCCVFGGSDTFDDSSTSTTCLYLSPSQLCLLK